MNIDWETIGPVLLTSIGQTIWMVLATMLIGGFLGLLLGILLYTTRQGGILANRFVFVVLNVLVNIIRPIPFIIFITAIAELIIKVVVQAQHNRANWKSLN